MQPTTSPTVAPTTTRALQDLLPTTTTTPVVTDIVRENAIVLPPDAEEVVIPSTAIDQVLETVPADLRNATTIRFRSNDGAWTYVRATDIRDVALPITGSSRAIQIEVIVVGRDTVAYSVELTPSEPDGTPQGLLLGIAVLFIGSLIVLLIRRRRSDQDLPPPVVQ
jgi:hypothetical protein